MILKLRDWIREIPTLETIEPYLGEWYSYTDSDARKYMSLAQVGGRQRAGDMRFPHYMVTIVSAKNLDNAQRNAAALEILAVMSAIVEHTNNPTCELINVAPVGEVIGPVRTDGGRMVATLTLELISE